MTENNQYESRADRFRAAGEHAYGNKELMEKYGFSRDVFQSYLADFGSWYLILLGALAIGIMLFAPRGIWGFVADRYKIVLFPLQRRLIDTSGEKKSGA